MAEFSTGRKGNWRWTAMISQPEAVTPEIVERIRAEVSRKKQLPALPLVRLERFDEGLSAQILHIGPYSAEGPTIEQLHGYIRTQGYDFDGHAQKHHEIYLGDPRRSAPEKLRTIIRQAVTTPG
jgi:hypothetical protein